MAEAREFQVEVNLDYTVRHCQRKKEGKKRSRKGGRE
jgi:hypothetical protein